MDLSRAMRLLAKLRDEDQTTGVARYLATLRQRMDQLASSPADTNAQTAVVEDASKLRQALAIANVRFSPEELAHATQLVGLNLFKPDMVDQFEEALAQNPATPAVARDFLTKIEQQRDAAANHVQHILSSGKELGWTNDEQEGEWEAEVGFKIPRDLFSNEFDRLIGEFRFLRRFLSNIAEIEGKALADIQLASLSTTDPLIVLGVAVVIAERVGKITKWALDCWKTLEEIRKIREETRKLKSFTEEEVEHIFGDKIRSEIDLAIEQKSKELASAVAENGRRHELENSFAMHLKEFLGRVERGMTVEIRLLASPAEPAGDDGDNETEAFQEMASSLRFPPPSPHPVLQITQQDGG